MSEVQSVQWFPGHMAKTRRAIQSSLKLVDIVAELIDARIPVSSRNPVLKSIIGNKLKIVLLNKSDMADPARTAEWVDYFKQHKTVAIPIDCKTGKGLNRLLPEINNILREQIAAWERKGMVGRPIRIMVVGVPNVGKSSLINRLCKGGNAGKAAVQDKPGVLAKIAGIFGKHGVSIESVIQKGAKPGDMSAPLILVTHQAHEKDLRQAIEEIKELDAVVGVPNCIRVEK